MATPIETFEARTLFAVHVPTALLAAAEAHPYDDDLKERLAAVRADLKAINAVPATFGVAGLRMTSA